MNNSASIVTKVLWSALLFSNFVFGYLVYSKLLGEGAEAATTVSYGLLSLGVLVAGGVYTFYKKTTSEEGLKKSLRNINLDNIQNLQMSKKQLDDFNNLDELGKKKFILRQQLLVKSILCWAVFESINTFGLAALVSLSTTTTLYYYHMTLAVLMMLMTYPSADSSLDRIRTF